MTDVQGDAPARSQYVEFWNSVLVPKFVRWRHILVGGLTLHSGKIFPSLQVGKGDKVIDAGCGFGDTAIELARLVGPTGSVLAVDCCDGFLEYGRRDARAAGIGNVTFLAADVQTYPFQPVHDFCFSRFGTQFFENPVAGLRNMRASLKPGGIMTMVVWRGITDNPWLGHAKNIVLEFLPPPGESAQTCGPGPFSMADTGVVTKQLEIAGYKTFSSSRSMRKCSWARTSRTPRPFSLPSGLLARSIAKPENSRKSATTRLQMRSNQRWENIGAPTA
jgi:ubiquinone/menaquinone biosynthesis C-methylase UbiE